MLGQIDKELVGEKDGMIKNNRNGFKVSFGMSFG
jgi:hypothetical protein